MRAVIRKHDQRRRQGKASVCRVRGKDVEYGDIVIYLKRKGTSIEDVLAQRSRSATPDAVVECSTPVPSQPSTPQEFAIPESVIRCARDYHQGSFESRTWVSGDPRGLCKSTKVHGDAPDYFNPLSEQCDLACRLFARSEFSEAGRTLICATAGVKKILQAERPETLIRIFGLVLIIALRDRLETARAVLRHFVDLGEVILGGCHPLSRICGWLASFESSRFQDVLMVCAQSVVDQFERFLGPMHRSTIRSRLEHLAAVSLVQRFGQGEAVIHKLLASCIQSLGSCDIRTLDVYRALAHLHLSKGDHIAVQRVAREIIHHARDVEPTGFSFFFYCNGLQLMARSQYMLGETASAAANQRQAIEMRMSGWGTTDGVAMTWLMVLEDWVAEQGNLAYAAYLRDWRLQILSSIEMEEQ